MADITFVILEDKLCPREAILLQNFVPLLLRDARAPFLIFLRAEPPARQKTKSKAYMGCKNRARFYTPPELNPSYTLPLINVMPPSSTDVIKDDDTSSSAISELNSD
jgi:hypothetical protein